MNKRQSNNQWSGGIAVHPAPKTSECKNPLEKFSPWFFEDQGVIFPTDYLPKGQTINAEYYLSLLMQQGHFEGKTLREGQQGGLVFAWQCHGSPDTCNPELATGLPGLPLSWSPTLFSGSGPVGLPSVPWTKKNNWKHAFFVRRGGHCCRWNLVGQTTFWFFLSGLQKLEQRNGENHLDRSSEKLSTYVVKGKGISHKQ